MTNNLNNLPLAATCGVLVCGGGTAGVIAAIAAAQAGADVLADFEKQESMGTNQDAGVR